MSGTYIDGHTVHLPDVNGFPSTIPTRVLHLVAHAANVVDSGRATFGLRTFDRDVLNGARELLDGRDRCQFADQYVSCDLPAAVDADGNTLTDLKDRPTCEKHAPDDDSGEMA